MVNENTHYRWDFIGLSTDVKPTPATSNKVVNGSTYYTSDDSKLYIFCDGTWYERKALGGGGGGDTSDFTILSDSDANYTSGQDSFIATWLLTTGTYRLADEATIGVLTGLDSNLDPLDDYYVDSQPIIFVQAGDVVETLVVNSQGVSYTLTDTTGSVTDSTYLNLPFQGATVSEDGTNGLVPAPTTTDVDKFLKGDGTWATPSGGGGVTVVQTTGTSTTDVMSQNAVTSMVFADPSIRTRVRIGTDDSAIADLTVAIGSGSVARGEGSVSIGTNSANYANGVYSVSIGNSAKAGGHSRAVAIGNYSESAHNNSIALGGNAVTTREGELNIGAGSSGRGYNSTNYRIIGGVHDGQLAQDAVTVNQVNGVIDAINTALSTNIPHIGASS